MYEYVRRQDNRLRRAGVVRSKGEVAQPAILSFDLSSVLLSTGTGFTCSTFPRRQHYEILFCSRFRQSTPN